ncbi:MAG TPA: outer membrane lipoprotein-sorting protein [Verrucomicrobiae bacterium]|nr:outer membrane lipoprotein-sorting protein [Verrucomicrobiae bacterium]
MITTRGKYGVLVAVLLVGIAAAATRAAGQSADKLTSSQASATVDQIIAQVIKHNDLRNAELHTYSAVRTYVIRDTSGTVKASKTVRMEYVAPDTKTFESISADGSVVVRDLVFDRLMETEAATAGAHDRHDTSITPANYTFQLLGQETIGAYHCYVVEAAPKREDKYLFHGQIWIDSTDFAVVKIAGHPAKRPSFWVTRADFVRQFEKVGDFWLPSRDETSVDVRLYGTKILSIEHRIDSVNGVTNARTNDNGVSGSATRKLAALEDANQALRAGKKQCK